MVETSGTITARPPRYELLDYLRLVAALMVVAYHWLVNGIASGKVDSIGPNDWATSWAKYGNLGVWLFFLISGFVITISTRGKAARQFAVSRFTRLYPAFWIALVFTTLVTIVAGGDTFEVTAKQFWANVTMVPSLFGQPRVDGAYWTLVYEVEFYALAGLVLLLGQGRRMDHLIALWTSGMVVASIVAPDFAASNIFTGGFFLLFASGAMIAVVRDRGPSWWSVVPLLGAWAMSVRFAMKKAEVATEGDGFTLDPYVCAAIVTACFLAVASMCLPRVAGLSLPYAQPLGALTYPVYLLHAHVGYMMLNQFATDSTKWLVYPALLAALLALGWVLHWLVDLEPRIGWIRRTADRTLGALVERVQPARFRPERDEVGSGGR